MGQRRARRLASVWTTAAVVLATLVAVTHPGPAAAATGALTVVAGSTGEGPGPSVAQDGYGLAVWDGRLYVADRIHNVVRAVDLATGYETVVAGTDVFMPGLDPYAGDTGDGGPALAARLYDPFSLAFDLAGNLFIGENGGSRVRRVDTAGIITTVAGGGASRAEGIPATDANLAFLLGVAIGPTGDLYISDYYNRVRRVDMTTGIITTVVGVGGSSAYAGDGGPAILAHLSSPGSLTFDPAGNLFFVDGGSIRKVDTAGIITTVVGGGPRGFGAEGPAREIPVAAHGAGGGRCRHHLSHRLPLGAQGRPVRLSVDHRRERAGGGDRTRRRSRAPGRRTGARRPPPAVGTRP